MKIFIFGYLSKNSKHKVQLFFDDYSKIDLSNCSQATKNTQNINNNIEVFILENLNFNLNKIITKLRYEKKISTKVISYFQLEHLINTFDSFVFFSYNNNTTEYNNNIRNLIEKRQKSIKIYL